MKRGTDQRCVTLVKSGHRFAFWFAAGQEDVVIDAFADLADGEQTPFDWFDAAILSYEVGRERGRAAEAPAEIGGV